MPTIAVPRRIDGDGPALGIERQVAAGVARTGVPTQAQFAAWGRSTVAALPADSLPGAPGHAVTVRIVGPDESRTLNAEWRGRNRPTNVLAFPAGGEHWPPGEPRPLGDIVICAEVVAAEAAEQGKPVTAHWCHMLVHGLLHLLGFDHVDEHDARAMETLERRVLAAEGIPDPYASTAAPVNC